jgi:hypothetical protein
MTLAFMLFKYKPNIFQSLSNAEEEKLRETRLSMISFRHIKLQAFNPSTNPFIVVVKTGSKIFHELGFSIVLGNHRTNGYITLTVSSRYSIVAL